MTQEGCIEYKCQSAFLRAPGLHKSRHERDNRPRSNASRAEHCLLERGHASRGLGFRVQGLGLRHHVHHAQIAGTHGTLNPKPTPGKKSGP